MDKNKTGEKVVFFPLPHFMILHGKVSEIQVALEEAAEQDRSGPT
jgi:hypothetical protein